ncbi:hypothetical protein U1Q18_018516 [Sarracenia purpurea var. burkii]
MLSEVHGGWSVGRGWWHVLLGGSEGILKEMVDSVTHYYLVVYCISRVCLVGEFRQLSLSATGGFKLLFERPCEFCYNLLVFPKSYRCVYGLFAATTFFISSLCSSKEVGLSGFLLGFCLGALSGWWFCSDLVCAAKPVVPHVLCIEVSEAQSQLLRLCFPTAITGALW